MSWIDLSIISLYFLVILVIGIYNAENKSSLKEYFLGKGSIGWFPLGIAMFATNISSGHFIATTASVFKYGIVSINYELIGAVCVLLFTFVFAPLYLKNNVFTIPEFLEKRFDHRSRMYLSVSTLFTNIVVKLSIYLWAGSVLLEQFLGLDIYTWCIVINLVTGLYSIVGGQKSIIRLEFLQGSIFIITSFILAGFCLYYVGGIDSLWTSIPDSHKEIIKPYNDVNYPWPGMFLGGLIVGIWYHCIDQEMGQKILSSKTIYDSKKSNLSLSFLKILPLFFTVITALSASILFKNQGADTAYFSIVNLMPIGIKGLVICGFIAALMSSLSACFNSCSTIFSFDIYQKIYNTKNEFILVNIGKIATFTISILGMIWVTFVQSIQGDILGYVISTISIFTPGLVAVFLLGIFWKKTTADGAIYTMLFGFFLGISKIFLFIIVSQNLIDNELIIGLGNIHTSYFSITSFSLCILSGIVISQFTAKPTEAQLESVQFDFIDYSSPNYSSINNIQKKKLRITTIIFIVIILTIYILFN